MKAFFEMNFPVFILEKIPCFVDFLYSAIVMDSLVEDPITLVCFVI